MKLYYFIKENGTWQRTDYDTYKAFDGEKEIRSPTYGLIMLQKHLQPLRWW